MALLEEYATVYLTIADTSNLYPGLDRLMYRLASQLRVDVDTLGRIYEVNSDSLVVPRDDADAWAGAYFPRRSEGNSLSIEYLSWYTEHSGPGTFALFTGIWPSRSAADSARTQQLPHYSSTFILEARIYTGCIH